MGKVPAHHTQILREAGLKVTQARLTVLKVLEESRSHLSSAEILERVSQIDNSIGRASVFRALDALTRLGVLRPIYLETSMTPAYILLHDGHHHHIVCTQCRRVIEIQGCGLDKMINDIESKHKVRLTGHLVEFYGLCEQCAVN